ncbi:MAG: hypothetical protein ACREAA_13665 [Candidatus Polarisedimenticolia bacterium]
METLIEAMRRTLPKFPDEILDAWLIPLSSKRSWPPAPNIYAMPDPSWAGILLNRPLGYWQSLTWTLESRPFDWTLLSSESAQLIRGLYEAYISGKTNSYSQHLGSAGKERFNLALDYLTEHGAFPEPIIVVEDAGRLTLVDGCHRATAFVAYKQMLDDPRLRANFNESVAPLRESQPMWVGRFGS